MNLTRLAVFLFAGTVSGFQLCPENCKLMKNSSLTPCETNSRVCFRGCIPGHYGNTCNMTCDTNCQGITCQQRGGTCRCKPGYKFNRGSCVKNKGATCRSSNHCRDNKCLSAGRAECLSGCDPGWFGSACNQPCEDRKSGNCTDGCRIGSYGSQCDQKCSQHCVSGCDQLSGDCVQCEAGWYGSTCQFECSAGCDGPMHDCHRDGRCTNGCAKGYYGEKCEFICPRQCYRDLCGINGTCSRCKIGFFGTFCHKACVRCTDDICNQITGECTHGCQSGYYGLDCIMTCGTCIDGVCSVSTGECITGCKSSHYGPFCNLTCKECKDGDCDQDAGECRHKEEKGEKWSAVQSWVGGSVAVIIVIPIVAGLFYMYRRLRRIHGVVYDIVKWRRPSPSAVQDVQCGAAPRDLELEEEVSVIPPRVCPISPARQTSYIEPRHSGDSTNILHIQHKVKAAGVSEEDEQQTAAVQPSDRLLHEVLWCSDEWSDKYTLPNYVEVNEELMASLPQPAQGAEACTPVVTTASFSVVADVHSMQGDISIPLIAESFGHTVTQDSSTDKDSQPYVENYDHLFSDGNFNIDRAIPVNDSSRIILPGVHPISPAKSAIYIDPRHSDGKVPTQQDISTARMFKKQEEPQPQYPDAPPSDRLPEDIVMTTLPQTLQGAEATVLNSSSSPTADVHGTGGDIGIPLITDVFGPSATKDSTPKRDS